MLDTFLFYLLDAIVGIGTILTAAAVIASHVIAFAIVWGARKPHVLRKPRWYDDLTDWADDREGLIWSLFVIATASLGCWSVWAWAQDDLPLQLFLQLCLVVPILGTWVGLLARFSKA